MTLFVYIFLSRDDNLVITVSPNPLSTLCVWSSCVQKVVQSSKEEVLPFVETPNQQLPFNDGHGLMLG